MLRSFGTRPGKSALKLPIYEVPMWHDLEVAAIAQRSVSQNLIARQRCGGRHVADNGCRPARPERRAAGDGGQEVSGAHAVIRGATGEYCTACG